MRRALVSSSISVMWNRDSSGVKVILVYSSPFLFSVIWESQLLGRFHAHLGLRLLSHVLREHLLVLLGVGLVGCFNDELRRVDVGELGTVTVTATSQLLLVVVVVARGEAVVSVAINSL
jgi:hypothetical protein